MTSSERTRQRYLHYLVGRGIDIGCGTTPVTPDCLQWDLPQGDAQILAGLADSSFDWVYSSHCLEHMRSPLEAILNWWRVLRPGGHLVVLVPDEDLYEQQCWPSLFNDDHKHTFTLHKSRSWSPASINITDLLTHLRGHRLLALDLCSDGHTFHPLGAAPPTTISDQSAEGAECSIALVVQKDPPEPASARTNLLNSLRCPACSGEVIIYGQLPGSPAWSARCARCGEAGKWTPVTNPLLSSMNNKG